MIVITLTDCPPALRGDLTKWFQQIDTGVYVGHASARVREEIWKRIRENAGSGRAIMVFSVNNEQRMDFHVHNASWEPIEFDGLKLMLRPSPERIKKLSEMRVGFSKASHMHRARQMAGKRHGRNSQPERYLVVDVETTGLSASEHEIIEIGALIVSDKQVEATFQSLIKPSCSVPPSIQALTGLSEDIIVQQGRALVQVIPEFISFAKDLPVVSHNVEFDYEFLRAACKRCGLPPFSNPCVDTLVLARRLVDDVDNYKLATLLTHFGIEFSGGHRSVEDCLTTKQLYDKLIELQQAEE